MNHDRQGEFTTVVPLVDSQQGHAIYHRSLLLSALIGAVAGALAGGIFAFLIADGIMPLDYFGQFSAAGTAPAVFAGAGTGFALGGLLGGVQGLGRLTRGRNRPT